MANGSCIRGGRAREWIPPCGEAKEKELPGRGGKLAAASRRERVRLCGCFRSLCLAQELAEQWVVEPIMAPCSSDQESFINESGEVNPLVLAELCTADFFLAASCQRTK